MKRPGASGPSETFEEFALWGLAAGVVRTREALRDGVRPAVKHSVASSHQCRIPMHGAM